MQGPGLARCSAWSVRLLELLSKPRAALTNAERKEIVARVVDEAGSRQGAEIGRILGKDRRTIAGYKNPLAGDKVPSLETIETLAEYVQWRAWTARFARSA